MTRRGRVSPDPPAPRVPEPDVPPGAHGLVVTLAATLPLLAHFFLLRWGVPLGCPGRMTYPYSPIADWRLERALWAMPLLIAVVVGVTALTAAAPRRRRFGAALLVVGSAALGIWTFFAPPDWRNQHVFNALSPAQDGAFVVETWRITDLTDYFATFPAHARKPPAELRGTRVISNPPAATALAELCERLTAASPRLRAALLPSDADAAGPAHVPVQQGAATGLLFLAVLTLAWLVSGLALYGIGGEFFRPPLAALFAVVALFTPMTLLFTPGKDAAQLLTAALPLWLWLRGWRRGAAWLAAAAGALLVVSMLVGLVHVWVAAIVLAATFITSARRGELRTLAMRMIAPAAGGAVAAALLLQLVLQLDVIAVSRAVAAAQATVTRGPDAMPLAWQLVGIPLFLLFVGPAWLALAAWSLWPRPGPRAGDPQALFGGALSMLTVLVLLGTIGFTNLETPRLWIPFVPLLTLGAMLSIREFRGAAAPCPRFLAGVVAVHLLATVLQWSLMDARATETRLLSGQFYGAPR